MIIDAKGAVLVDLGAMDFFADIKVEPNAKDPSVAGKITLTPKAYMAHAPLITGIDATMLEVVAERGAKLDWICTLYYAQLLASESSEAAKRPQNRLGIEVLDR